MWFVFDGLCFPRPLSNLMLLQHHVVPCFIAGHPPSPPTPRGPHQAFPFTMERFVSRSN
jgi:hypothetical protein